jgi:hypothetical protein
MGNYSEGMSGFSPGDTVQDVSGDVFTADAAGVLYLSGTDRTTASDNSANWITVGDTGTEGRGPGDSWGAQNFNLGQVANGVNNIVQGFTSTLPAVVSGVRNARTAVTAMNTPTSTQQWLKMPLQSQIMLGLAVFAVVVLVLKVRV